MSAVPKLRFPEFDGECIENTLGQIGSVSMCKRIMKDQTSTKGDVPFFKIGTFGRAPDAFISCELYEEYKNRYSYPRKGEILISAAGTIGRLVVFDGAPAYFQDSNIVWLANSEEVVLNPFLYQFLLTVKWTTEDTTIARLYNDNLRSIPLLSPSIPEQQKIASFLSSVDKKIDLLRQKKDALELYKKGLMQKIFSQEIRFKHDDGSDFPEWEEVALGDVFEEIKDKVGDRKIPTYSISAGIGFVSQEEKFGKDISGRQNEKYTVLGVGDFSYNKGNSKTYTYGCIYPNNKEHVISVPGVFISFRRKDISTSVGFFAKLFEGHYLDRGLRTLISSGARMDGLLNVNKKDFFDLRVPFPNSDEQNKIADFLSALDSKIQSTSSQIEQMETFKKGLLQQMFV